MFCKKCGTPIPEGFSFCSNCGTPAEDVAPEKEKEIIPQNEQPDGRSEDGTFSYEAPKRKHIPEFVITIAVVIVALIICKIMMVSEFNKLYDLQFGDNYISIGDHIDSYFDDYDYSVRWEGNCSRIDIKGKNHQGVEYRLIFVQESADDESTFILESIYVNGTRYTKDDIAFVTYFYEIFG
ncbi:MAG: zinc-ribbon domain-containing protein [Oscillospiraceae bacterium]